MTARRRTAGIVVLGVAPLALVGLAAGRPVPTGR